MASFDEMLETMDTYAAAVAVLTGIKAQFTNAGWTNTGAEAMVLELVRSARGNGHAD